MQGIEDSFGIFVFAPFRKGASPSGNDFAGNVGAKNVGGSGCGGAEA